MNTKFHAPLFIVVLLVICISQLHAAYEGPINSGETRSGTVSSPGFQSSWTFAGTQGQRVIVNAVTTSGDLDTFIQLYGPGDAVPEVEGRCYYQGHWYGCDQVDCQLDSTGVYTLVISDFAMSSPGDYCVSFLQIPGGTSSTGDPDGGPIVSGETLAGSINAPCDMDAFTFSGHAGERVLINAVTTSGNLDTVMYLYPPSGASREETPTCWSNPVTPYGCDQLDWPLTSTGTYTIVIQDYKLSETGTYNISFLQIPGLTSSNLDLDGGPTASGQTRKASISVPGDMDAYTFYGQAGERVIINAATSSGNIDSFIMLYPPAGGTREADTTIWYNGAYYGLDQMDRQLAQTGLYTVIVQDYALAGTGEYSLSLTKIPGATSCVTDMDGGFITSGTDSTCSIDVAADMDIYTFYGQEGERVIIDAVTVFGSLDTFIVLYPPRSAAPEASTTCGPFTGYLYGCDRLDHVLDHSGLYTIAVMDFFEQAYPGHPLDGTGGYVFAFNKIPPIPSPGIYHMLPKNGARFIPPSQLLQWDAVGGATGYDVYLGTDTIAPLPPVATNIPFNSYLATGLQWDERYYWQVVAHTATGDIISPVGWFWSGSPNNIGSIRGAPATGLTLCGIVTGKFTGFMYVESEDRSSGARVSESPSGVAVGDRIQIIGNTSLADGQKLITPTAPIQVLSSQNPLPYLGIRNRDIGGHEYGPSDPGVTNGRGALNVGLLVKIHGLVTYKDTSGDFFYIWDGGNRATAPVNDGNSAGAWGVRIAHSGVIDSTAVVPWTDWVEVEGIVSVNTTAVSGKTIPEILPSVEPIRLTAADFTTVDFPAGTILAGKNLVGVPYTPGNVGNGDPSGRYHAYDPVDVFGPSYTGDWLADAEAIDGRIIRWASETGSSVGFDMWKPHELGGVMLGDGYWVTAGSNWTTCSYKARVQNIPQWISGNIGKVLIANPQDHNVLLDPANMEPAQDPAIGVQMSDGAQVKSFYDASTYGEGWIQSTGIWWDNAAGSSRDTGVVQDWAYDTRLLAWHGYWFTWLQNYKSMIVP